MRLLVSNKSDKPTDWWVFYLGGFIPTCHAQTCVEMAKLEKSMFRPPPDYVWKQKVKAYETKFGDKVPQWAHTLSINDAVKLLNSCLFLNYKLSTEYLIAGEPLSGFGGLWNPQRNRWDFTPKEPTPLDWSKQRG